MPQIGIMIVISNVAITGGIVTMIATAIIANVIEPIGNIVITATIATITDTAIYMETTDTADTVITATIAGSISVHTVLACLFIERMEKY
jgi:hypothetical protein